MNRTEFVPIGDSVEQQREKLRQTLAEIGVILHGHFLLTSGRHSGVYFEKFRLLERPEVLKTMVREMLNQLAPVQVEVVIGPTLGGVLVAYETARQLGVRALYAEREGEKRVFRRDGVPPPDTPVLIVDDVLTTGTSLREVVELAHQHHLQVRAIGVLIDRSEPAPLLPKEGEQGGKTDALACLLPYKIVSALRLPAESYDPSDCPLCQQGIPLIKRGSRGESF